MRPHEDHAWRDYGTPKERLARLADPQPERRPGPSAAQRVAASIAAGIEARVWRQGEKLPASAPIAARFRVSADTAREAVRLLIEQGYAERQRGGSTYCRGPRTLL